MMCAKPGLKHRSDIPGIRQKKRGAMNEQGRASDVSGPSVAQMRGPRGWRFNLPARVGQLFGASL